jgi:hypothetical protein
MNETSFMSASHMSHIYFVGTDTASMWICEVLVFIVEYGLVYGDL